MLEIYFWIHLRIIEIHIPPILNHSSNQASSPEIKEYCHYDLGVISRDRGEGALRSKANKHFVGGNTILKQKGYGIILQCTWRHDPCHSTWTKVYTEGGVPWAHNACEELKQTGHWISRFEIPQGLGHLHVLPSLTGIFLPMGKLLEKSAGKHVCLGKAWFWCMFSSH